MGEPRKRQMAWIGIFLPAAMLIFGLGLVASWLWGLGGIVAVVLGLGALGFVAWKANTT